jgi:tetratricopeptide (TPR) repeat protein
MKFLTQGQKIKELRTKLNMKQDDLKSENVTRAFISMVESEKRSIRFDTAKAITEKLNNRADELGISLGIDANYIFRSAAEDAEIYCLKKLSNSAEMDDINEIIQISTEFELKKIRASAYSKLGDLYFNCLNYRDAFINYNMALVVYKDLRQEDLLPHLYKLLGYCKFKLVQYKEALLYFNYAETYSVIQKNTKIHKQAIYNIALCYKKLDEIDQALRYTEKCISMCSKTDEFELYIYAHILKANCYECREDIDSALNTYDNLTIMVSKVELKLLGIVYTNIGALYLKKNDYVKSLEYFDLAWKIRVGNDSLNLHHTIIEKSTVFIKQEHYDEAIELINLGLESALKFNDMEYLLRGKYLLVQIYDELKNYTKLEQVYLSIIDLLKGNDKDEEILKIYISLSIMYLKQNRIIDAEEILQMSQKFCDNRGAC